MVGAGQPEDARCPCTTKVAELTDDALVLFCDGHMGPLALPYKVLAGGKEAIKAHLSGLPPRKKLFGSARKKRRRK